MAFRCEELCDSLWSNVRNIDHSIIIEQDNKRTKQKMVF